MNPKSSRSKPKAAPARKAASKSKKPAKAASSMKKAGNVASKGKATAKRAPPVKGRSSTSARRVTKGATASPPSGRTSGPSAYRSNLTEGLAYVDGKVMAAKDARIPLQDRGFLLGDGIFETLRTAHGEVFRLDDHAARVQMGLSAINLDEAIVEEFHDAVHALASQGRRTMGEDLYLRIMITSGPMEDVAGTGRGLTVAGLCRKFKPYPMAFYAHGIHAITSQQRKDPSNPLSAVKTLSFLPYVTARREAHAAAVHDAILLNLEGRVAEASTSNIFAAKNNVVYAPGPSEGAVAGVTRGVVLELLEEAGITVKPQLTRETLRGADEAWLTNTTGGVVPLTRIDDDVIGNGKKGELTMMAGHGLEAMLRNHLG